MKKTGHPSPLQFISLCCMHATPKGCTMGTSAAMQTFFNNSDTKPNPGGFEGFLNSLLRAI